MARVLIDVTRLADRALEGRLPTGIDRVSLAYIEHFFGRARALVRFGGRWVHLRETGSKRVFEALLQPTERNLRALRLRVGRGYVLPWRRTAAGGLLFNTGHSGLDLPGYAAEVRRRRMRPVYFLHDLIPITHPEYCRPGEAEKHRRRLETMIFTAEGLIVNSNVTRVALEKYAGERDWKLPRCVVAPLAPARLPPPQSERPMTQPYFVVLGTIEPRKNHLLLLNLWRDLVEQFGAGAPRLVVIGQRGWECEQVIDLLERSLTLRGTVVEVADCDDQSLSTLLYHAQALLFPSFVEGFGIPLIEALMLGVPVIASDLPVFHEIAGGLPQYLHPIDGLGWKRAITDFANDPIGTQGARRDRLAGYKAPSWEQHFSAVEALLGELLA